MKDSIAISSPLGSTGTFSGVSLIIPVYNEELSIGPVLDEVIEVMKHQPHPYEVLVVDDGSTDNTVFSETYPCSSEECTVFCPPCGSCREHGSNSDLSPIARELRGTANTPIWGASKKPYGIFGPSDGCRSGTDASKL